jgi:DNA polymerase
MSLFLPGERIMRAHGQPRKVGGRLIVPMLHPAAALHQPQNRPLIEADFRSLPTILARAEAEQAAAQPQPKPVDESPAPGNDKPFEQLSLF